MLPRAVAASRITCTRRYRQASKEEGGAKLALRSIFGKTYFEKQGWSHCYHVFGRIFMWHQVGFHLLMCFSFNHDAFWSADNFRRAISSVW